MNKEEFAINGVDKASTKILEFGPFYCPMYKKIDGYNVEIVDRISRIDQIEFLPSWGGC